MKDKFKTFLESRLGVPALFGSAPLHKFKENETVAIAEVIHAFTKVTSLPEGMDRILQPQEFLGALKSILIVAFPSFYDLSALKNKRLRGLRGVASLPHVSPQLLQVSRNRTSLICAFFQDQGHVCRPVTASLQFPAKLLSVRCGIGYYGKNSMIIHPEYGSWLSFQGFITDAQLAMDKPVEGSCGSCRNCVNACPTGAIAVPYQCKTELCLNFHLGHNKKFIPHEIRAKSAELIGSACRICRDACPRNRGLKSIDDVEIRENVLFPDLEETLNIGEEEWKQNYGGTMMGLGMRDKRYLQRNAAIALGNVKDLSAVAALARQLEQGEDEVRGYAAWALGRIGGDEARAILECATAGETHPQVLEEIQMAGSAAQRDAGHKANQIIY